MASNVTSSCTYIHVWATSSMTSGLGKAKCKLWLPAGWQPHKHMPVWSSCGHQQAGSHTNTFQFEISRQLFVVVSSTNSTTVLSFGLGHKNGDHVCLAKKNWLGNLRRVFVAKKIWLVIVWRVFLAKKIWPLKLQRDFWKSHHVFGQISSQKKLAGKSATGFCSQKNLAGNCVTGFSGQKNLATEIATGFLKIPSRFWTNF